MLKNELKKPLYIRIYRITLKDAQMGCFFGNNPNGHFLTKKSGLLSIKQPKKSAKN
jgi:hypothetical protein